MKYMNILFMTLLSFLFINCNEQELQMQTEKTALYFQAVADGSQVKLKWENESKKAYDIWRAIDDRPYKKIMEGITESSYVDNVSDLEGGTQLTYRMVNAGGYAFAADILRRQQSVILRTFTIEELMDEVQKNTLKYFTDFAHPDCGLTRERSNIPDDLHVVTTGGTGFGIMAIIAGTHRGFITRDAAYNQIRKITDFLQKVETFHGAYAHWYFGNTGLVKPFSDKDNGGDLVETSFLMQGLIVAYEYFKDGNDLEKKLAADINTIWRNVDWKHYTKNENKLYWHWSKQYDFAMNMGISGWNEGLMSYVLAAASPTYGIEKAVYESGYANNGAMKNGKTYYDITLPLGNDGEMGGPLFFAHYSFMGLDPNGLKDQYCDNYFEQNRAHVMINRAYCIDNPKEHKGYSEQLWGLTASDCPVATYLAHAPGNNDNGTIAPTAALASIPYAPEQCLKVMDYLYYDLKDKIWGEYGFYDAINLGVEEEKQVVKSHLAIDQGPIVVMIENYRSGYIWELFMRNEDVQNGLKKLGFSSTKYNIN